MPQQTNLNVAPYFDDFDPTNDYQKVLFKPGYPVQARELSTLQSILQNQVEKFGQHFFKEGAKVIPGNIGYSQLYYAVQLANTFQGVPVEAYVDQLVGATITGQTSGVTAVVDNILSAQDSERGSVTLYVSYSGSSRLDNSTQTFSDGESLICNQIISSGLLGNSTISPGTPFANTLSNNATATGSVFQIEEGVYFIRGHFVNVNKESLLLDQYTNTPSYRVGLFVSEEIINANADESLNDNSQGFNNYGAPGADRLQISVSLFKKSIDDLNDDNFVELVTIENGDLKVSPTKRGGSSRGNGAVFHDDLTDVLARRTFDESGHYIVKPFNVSIANSLNDNLGNQGLYEPGQFTAGGTAANADLAVCKLSPGKAYVKGYEIETIGNTIIDVPKPRTTKTVENQFLTYNTGPTLKLNSVYRSPTIGVGNTFILSLRDERVGVNSETAPGKEIGLARVFDFRLESGTYNSALPDDNEWGMSMYDIQPFTEIEVNESVSLTIPSYVEGSNSGATAFLRSPVVGTALTVYDKRGEFAKNETLVFRSGISTQSTTINRVAKTITPYGISNVKSVYSNTGIAADPDNQENIAGINTFSANVVQTPSATIGIASVTVLSGGISTVTSSNKLFPGNIKTNSLLQYSDISLSDDPITAKVVSVGSSHITVTGVTTVTGVVNGKLPEENFVTSDLELLTTQLDVSSDNTLFTILPKRNIATVNLTDAEINIRKTFTVNITNNQLDSTSLLTVTLPEGETYLSYSDERYTLIRSDGVTESLSADKFQFSSNLREVQIRNLGTNNEDAQLIVTVKKSNIKSKKKIKDRVRTLVVDKSINPASGIGSTTLNDGLSYGDYAFGTRVQDNIISLNTPDIIRIHGIYETSDVSLTGANFGSPEMTLAQLNGPTASTGDMIIGELLIGQSSGAVAVFGEIKNSSDLRYLPKNNFKFIEGEIVVFQESLVQGIISTLDTTSFNITSNYTFASGQRNTIYNHGSLTRKSDSNSPKNKIKIYYKSASFDSSDDGDIITVESYNDFNYSTEVKIYDNVLNTDIIDLRPRVSDYTTATSTRSPLEFLGRSFDGLGNSVPNILASNETIFLDYSYYQGRIDRLFLNKSGRFQLKFGVPSDDPKRSKPQPIESAIEVAEISYPPYLHNTQQASIKFLKYKRFQMKDIKHLEDRIKNLEYYTQLSLLETNTANQFISDANGLNRFKSGFFVDNFTSVTTQDITIGQRNSIDQSGQILRPKHITNELDLQTGPVVDVDTTADKSTSAIDGVNVRKESDIISLEYSEVEWINQPFATRTESVTPFLISFWQGTVTLTPSSDNWVTPNKMESKTIDSIGNYTQVLANYNENYEVDPETGFAPTVWNSWEDNWSGGTKTDPTTVSGETTDTGDEYNDLNTGWINGHSGVASIRQDTTVQATEQDVVNTIETGRKERTGSRPEVIETFETIELGEKVISTEIISTVRSRNVQFSSANLKPSTRIYAFFDGKDVTKYCVPKLIEITMKSGTFEVGESVEGRVQTVGLSEEGKNTDPQIDFRVAQSNHRKGDYDSPTQVYPDNPYVSGGTIPEVYSSTSTTLNVDTYSLSNQPQGDFFGYIQTGMILTGKTSGAEAEVTDVRLISDTSSALIGSLFIPDPNNGDNPNFKTGTNVFTLVNDPENDQNAATTIGEQAYTTSGIIETVQDQILSIRNASIENREQFEAGEDISKILDTEYGEIRNVGDPVTTSAVVGYYDPLAQSFAVETSKDPDGVFVTKCDVFFRTKDDGNTPIRMQIRTMKDGFPTPKYDKLSEVILDPPDINTSTDGSVATTFQFGAPLYLEPGLEYAICLVSNSKKYSVYISRVGENDILTDSYVSDQPNLGSLFKSQNASTWEASQWEDLKFILYRADFVESGTIDLYNPELSQGNSQIANLMENPLNISSKEIRVGLGTTVADNRYVMGNTFSQVNNTTATGDLVGVAASATGTMTITNPGIGYTPANGSTTFPGVNLVTISGTGSGAVADVSIQDGVVTAAAISGNGGDGYQVGDVVSINAIGAGSVGRNARFTLNTIGDTSQLILNNVQGDFVTGAGGTLTFFDSSNTLRELNSGTFNETAFTGDVTINASTTVSDGLHVKVNHVNHGMNFDDNFVRIVGIRPDIKPTKLTAEYSKSSTDPIAVSSGTGDIFNTFENVPVGSTNTGLILIGEEVIEYTSTTSSQIGGNISRGTTPKTYAVGTPVYKYELSGVSLARLNKTHHLNDVTVADPINLDSYHIKLDMSQKYGTSGQSANADRSSSVSGFPKLFIGASDSTGGSNVKATKNIPFEIIKPSIQNIAPEGTTITAQMRTTTSQSISGNEIPYINAGFEDVTLDRNNYLDSPRAIFSKVNEDRKLSSIEGNKSFQMRLSLGTVNSKISPQIDLEKSVIYAVSNRVNSKILNYAEDSRVNTMFNDPSACQYISKEISLENPATSLQIMVDGQIPSECDIRALYSVSGDSGFGAIFTPFPGYLNIDSRGLIINEEDSDGRTDVLVQSSNKRGFGTSDTIFREHKFSVDDLPSFRSYRIKLVMTSTNQVLAPQIKNLRVIALA
jgi:hypothetical protein